MPSCLYDPNFDVVVISWVRIQGCTRALRKRQKKLRESLKELFRMVFCSVRMKRPANNCEGITKIR